MLNTIELFAGCGGLLDGFKQTKKYNLLAAVEWQKSQVHTLIERLNTKYNIKDANNKVFCFDIQRTKELINGWENDAIYLSSKGINAQINGKVVDIISGGPPCQAYSIAGRVRDQNRMKDDYRNFLFESYISVVEFYKPKIIVFENVEGMLSAIPTGEKITNLIKKGFKNIGYEIIDDIKTYALFNLADFGIPQNRKRVIIIGIRIDKNSIDYQYELQYFYSLLLKNKPLKTSTVRDAIGDLPPIYPLENPTKKIAYDNNSNINGHVVRFHNKRDQDIFFELATDIKDGTLKYVNSHELIDLYYEKTGKKTNVHKYHVLKWDEPSNTIPAHLKKDGLRHIHPDPEQKRSITVREAARLQTFDDDFSFNSSMSSNFEMIGNAVPPKFAKLLGDTLYEFFNYLKNKESN